ncbi:T9SS type A sorting domain-containing protein [Terrimonas alba]|uniref:T9SS type A sorting domain-containing protein n=1 Tax=Terrimonas alba TaxID=3349636 RepID=UPI0035F43B28
MKNATTIIVGILISAICNAQSISSSVINVNGGTAKNGYYQFEWSIGEMALVSQMQSGDRLMVSNGFLQPYLLFPGTFYGQGQFAAEEVKIFPNPASRFIEINFFTKQKGQVTFGFYDMLGKKVFAQQITCNGVDLIHRIPLANLPSGSYLLQINLEGDAGYLSKHGAYKILKIE